MAKGKPHFRGISTALCLLLWLSGCGGEPAGPTPPPPPPAPAAVASVQLTLGSTVLEEGDSTTYSAVARDASGAVLNRPVTFGVSGPLTLRADGWAFGVGHGTAAIEATAESKSASATVNVNGWQVSSSVDPVTLVTTQLWYRRSVLPASGTSTHALLVARCRANLLEVFVNTGLITANGQVDYRLSGAGPVTATWLESTSFESLFVPRLARRFLLDMSAADTLFFRFNQFGSGSRLATFNLKRLNIKLPAIVQACPPTLESLRVTPPTVTLRIGEEFNLLIEPLDDAGLLMDPSLVTLTSLSPGTASIIGLGRIRALSVGTALIRASVSNPLIPTAFVTVTVTP